MSLHKRPVMSMQSKSIRRRRSVRGLPARRSAREDATRSV